MSKPLSDAELIEFIPHGLKTDADLSAMAEAVQPGLSAVTDLSSIPELYARLDELSDGVLHMLAWENGMSGAEWALTQTTEERAALVRESYWLNKLRGTRWSVERIFEILGIEPEIVEWWEESPRGNPYTFKIRLYGLELRGLAAGEGLLIVELIRMYKPLRTWIAFFDLLVPTETNIPVISATIGNGAINVYHREYSPTEYDTELDQVVQHATSGDFVLNVGYQE